MKTHTGAMTAPLILMWLAVAPLPATAQERETRPLTGFNAVEVGGGIDLVLRQGDVFAVEVEAEDGEVAEIVTELRDRTLEIHRKSSFSRFFSWGDDHGTAHVTLPVLVALRASGGSDVTTQGTFSSDSLQLAASGGSDLTIDVAAGSLEAEASGGSDMRLSGSARSARVQSSGGSDLNASRLTADAADVHSSGGSDLSIAVRDRIVGNASGGSDITYTGNPQTVDVDTSGGADVRRR
jgi:hypothetical protein